MDSGQIATIASLGLTVAAAALGNKYLQGKVKLQQLLKVFNDVIAAAEDEKVTDEEFAKIVADAKELVK
jgi:hypothetical protein